MSQLSSSPVINQQKKNNRPSAVKGANIFKKNY